MIQFTKEQKEIFNYHLDFFIKALADKNNFSEDDTRGLLKSFENLKKGVYNPEDMANYFDFMYRIFAVTFGGDSFLRKANAHRMLAKLYPVLERLMLDEQ